MLKPNCFNNKVFIHFLYKYPYNCKYSNLDSCKSFYFHSTGIKLLFLSDGIRSSSLLTDRQGCVFTLTSFQKISTCSYIIKVQFLYTTHFNTKRKK